MDIIKAISAELENKRTAFENADISIPLDIGLLFYTKPEKFVDKAEHILTVLNKNYAKAEQNERELLIETTMRICLGLSTDQVRWNLSDKNNYPDTAIGMQELNVWSDKFRDALQFMCISDKSTEKKVLDSWTKQLAERYKAEGLSAEDANNLAASHTDDCLISIIEIIKKDVQHSNSRRFAEACITELGNDYGLHLDYPLFLGASFVTTNPPLILMAAKQGALSKSEWDKLCADKPNWLSAAAVAARMVVKQNALALRPIFLLTGGQKGYVCLQVDPRYISGNEMSREAKYQYEELRSELGGVPNVVFKLPATKAGLDACKTLAEMGIGSTATACFGVFQAMEFAEVMSSGKALVSYVVVMNGRLAGPVMEELSSEDVNAGRMAGVAVAKKLQKLFYSEKLYDKSKVRLLIASLRAYDDGIPDIEDVLGVPVLTIFPDIRRAFDFCERNLNMKSVSNRIADEVITTLAKSEIFRQAYYLPGNKDSIRPQKQVSLDDGVLDWEPVRRTLSAFKDAYKETEDMSGLII